MANSTFTLSKESRYKDTPVFSQAGALEFGLWEPPAEFVSLATGYRVHHVVSNEVGFLDLIAVQYYGAGAEHLSWAIAQANALANPENEMYPGMALFIPPRTAVIQFQSRQGNVAQSNG